MTTTTHQSRTHNTLQRYSIWQNKTESRIIEYDTWLQTQFPELLTMSEWCSKHVEFYHQIKSIKSCILLVFIWSLYSTDTLQKREHFYRMKFRTEIEKFHTCKFQLNPPIWYELPPPLYSNVLSEIPSITGQTTVLLSLAMRSNNGSSHPVITLRGLAASILQSIYLLT